MMTSGFTQGDTSINVSGPNLSPRSFNEQHAPHSPASPYSNRSVVEINGNIYGYTHSARSDRGPIISHSHTTNLGGHHYDENSSLSFCRSGGGPLTTQTPYNESPNALVDNCAEPLPTSLNLTEMAETRLPSASPGTEYHKLEAEFRRMSPEMKQYVFGQLQKQTTTDYEVQPMSVPRRSAEGPPTPDMTSMDGHSEPGVHNTYRIANSISKTPITSSSHTPFPESQSLLGDKPSVTADSTNPNTRYNSQTSGRENPPDVAPEAKRSVMKRLGALVRKLSKKVTNLSKGRMG